MMNLIENSNFGMGPEEFGADIPITPQENFVNGVYSSVDEATACALDRLRSEHGIIPTCKVGCCHCCRHHILTNIAEAHTLAQYVKRELSVDQINDLRMRTQQWHEWDNSRPGRYQRLSREASRVSNAFCLFASSVLLRSKRSGMYRRRSGSAHVRCDGDKSVFNGNKGSYRKRRLEFLSVNNASSALVGD
jgi:hypothetical protein